MRCVMFACIFDSRLVSVEVVGWWCVGDVVDWCVGYVIRFVLLVGVSGFSLRVLNTTIIRHCDYFSVVVDGAGLWCYE